MLILYWLASFCLQIDNQEQSTNTAALMLQGIWEVDSITVNTTFLDYDLETNLEPNNAQIDTLDFVHNNFFVILQDCTKQIISRNDRSSEYYRYRLLFKKENVWAWTDMHKKQTKLKYLIKNQDDLQIQKLCADSIPGQYNIVFIDKNRLILEQRTGIDKVLNYEARLVFNKLAIKDIDGELQKVEAYKKMRCFSIEHPSLTGLK